MSRNILSLPNASPLAPVKLPKLPPGVQQPALITKQARLAENDARVAADRAKVAKVVVDQPSDKPANVAPPAPRAALPGVCLVLYGADETISRRMFFASDATAYAAGEAYVARGEASRYAVAPEIKRDDVLASDRPAPEARIPLAAWRYVGRPRDGHWSARAVNTRVYFSHG